TMAQRPMDVEKNEYPHSTSGVYDMLRDTNMSKRYRGSCLCGMVAFVLDQFLGPADHCHCSMCRKFHGAAYATFVSVERQAFHWVSGQELVSDYMAPNGTVRSFCGRCGSSLFFVGAEAAAD